MVLKDQVVVLVLKNLLTSVVLGDLMEYSFVLSVALPIVQLDELAYLMLAVGEYQIQMMMVGPEYLHPPL